MTEITWSYIISRAGEILASGAFTTIDLSYPARLFAELQQEYNATKITAVDSRGRIWEKEWP